MTGTGVKWVPEQSRMRTVLIIQRVISHYRLPFFQRLYQRLASEGIRLTVIYGQEHPAISSTVVTPCEPWAVPVQNRYLSWRGWELVWQDCLRQARTADLVIVEQAGRLLVNYPLLALRRAAGYRLAYWGHGRNWQAAASVKSVVEQIKGRLALQADWWFAYTERTAEILDSLGVATDRITVVRNTVDAEELRRGVEAITDDDLARLRQSQLITGDHVALYCGGMYAQKRLDFLLDACREIHEVLPNFILFCIGAGAEQGLVEEAARTFSWVRYLGPLTGNERATYFRLAKVLLMPGAVGLAVIDSFAAGVPMVTTDLASHGPEIAYLDPGRNGIVTADDRSTYARAVVELLTNPTRQEELAMACRSSGDEHGLDSMVERFAEGICRCLDLPRETPRYPCLQGESVARNGRGRL